MENLGIYIHIPFCKKKCNYCAFFTFSGKLHKSPSYFQAVAREIENYSQIAQDYKISTIYIGGGTPSHVDSKFIVEVVKKIRENFRISENVEITIEANPESITKQKLQDYLNSGINRISIGLQAWSDEILKFMDRLYTIEEFEEKFNLVRGSGFKNINLDLILGVPGQTYQNWVESVDQVLQFNPNHIACYSLELDVDSKWGMMYRRGKFEAQKEEVDREMYWYAVSKLKENGYKHYEISNFCKKGFESKHNLSFWEGEEYLGIGAGAHGFFDNNHYNNIYSIEKYISNTLRGIETRENVYKSKGKEAMFDFLLLRMRLLEGLHKNEFEKIFNKKIDDVYKNELEELKGKGLILNRSDKLLLTKKGIDLINQVMATFI